VLCTDVVSVSTSRSRAVVSKHLGLVSVSWKRGKVSVSIWSRTENQMSRSRTIGSHLQANMHSFLLHCKIALHHFECKASILFTDSRVYLFTAMQVHETVSDRYCFISEHCLLYAVARPSVCNARAPYSAGWNFWQCFYVIWCPGHPLTSVENFTEIVEHLRRGQ